MPHGTTTCTVQELSLFMWDQGLVSNKRPRATENDVWRGTPPSFTPKLEWCDTDLDKLGKQDTLDSR